MNRRNFIKSSALATAGLATSNLINAGGLFGKSKAERPNILFIMTDQQTASAMSCAGRRGIKTPSMDYLASHGMRFTKAYCSQPLSGPSRSSIFTGQMPHEVKTEINLPETEGFWKDVPMMGKMLKKAGYDTGYVGKWHLPCPTTDKNLHGFDYITNIKRRDWQDASIPADCNDFFRQKRDNPFLLVASFVNPHDICEWARNQGLRMDLIGDAPAPSDCPELPDNFEIPKNEPEVIRSQQKHSVRTYPTTKWNEDQWRQYRWAYNRLIEKVDTYIGNVVESLQRNNLLDDTLIIFTSDHGDGDASHRWNQKQVLYEESINVPFIISWKDKIKASVNSQNLVGAGIDIIPTMCDYAGISTPKHLNGKSLKPIIEKKSVKWRDNIVVETEFSLNNKSFDIKGRTVIDNDYKYIVYNKGKIREQLFDLRTDAGEMNNLTFDPKHSKTLNKMRQKLKDWQENTNDKI